MSILHRPFVSSTLRGPMLALSTPSRPARVLTHPAFWLALAGLVLNDHWLKGSALLPSAWTGKLSDGLGMLVAPTVLAVLFRVHTRRGFLVAHASVLALFAAINLSQPLADAVAAIPTALGVPSRLWADPSDIAVALPAAILGAIALGRVAERASERRFDLWRRTGARLALAAALVGCVATSRLPPPRIGAGADFAFVPLGHEGGVALVDANTGKTLRTLRPGMSSYSTPVLVDGTIVGVGQGDEDDVLLGLSAETGATLFRQPVKASHYGPLPVVSGVVLLEVVNDDYDPELAGFRASDGKRLWQTPLPDDGFRTTHYGREVILAASDEDVRRIDAGTGRLVWSSPTEDVVCMATLGEHAYFQQTDAIVVVELATGKPLRRHEVDARAQRRWTTSGCSLVASDHALFLVTSDGVLVLDRALERIALVPDVYELVSEEGMILGAAGNNEVRRLDAHTGRVTWSYRNDFWAEVPTVRSGRVYLGGDEHVVALDAHTGRKLWVWAYPDN